MVDLHGQYLKIKEEVDAAIAGVLESCAFINGPEVKEFQKELETYLGVKHVIPCANGTDALQIAMMALDFQPGDEVITADFTYAATAEVIGLLKLKPVLVEVYKDNFSINPRAVEAAITERTKAIVPVHLFGQCVDMEQILDIAKRHNLAVIEDTAQAIGSELTFSDGTVKKAGTMGTIGTTSFFPSKNLGAYGDGGAIYTNDDDLAKKLRMVANHGQSVQYYHDEIGVNSRLDSMQAAILRIKLRHLNEYAKARQHVATYYDNIFSQYPSLVVPDVANYSTHVYHQYTLQILACDRNELRKHLADKGIPAMIYYPLPLHTQKAYLDPRYKDGDFPITEELCRTVLSLPIHTEMEEEQMEYIVNSVLEFVQPKVLS